MFQIIETDARRPTVLDTAKTFDAAKAQVESMGVEFMEDDADYVGCADAYLKDGRVIAIQPEGFKLGAVA
jgi:hypothetical protein